MRKITKSSLLLAAKVAWTNSFKRFALVGISIIALSSTLLATQYCQQSITAGGKTVLVSLTNPSTNTYVVLIESTDVMTSLYANIWANNVNGAQAELSGTGVLSNGGKTITMTISSTTVPSLYTSLYINMPGLITFPWPSNITWGTCTTGYPTLAATTAATSITSTTAASGGNVTDIGTSAVTAKGVCWGTTTGPLVTGSHTTDGTGSGTFTSSLSGLTPGTTYYVRSYATNTAGTAYGAEVSFTTTLLTGNLYINDGTFAAGDYCTAAGQDIAGNDGTSAKPFATLAYALSRSVQAPGDIIYIDAGTYSWASTHTFTASGTLANPITIQGKGNASTIITSTTAVNSGLYFTTGNNWVVKDLQWNASSARSVWVESATGITLNNCAFNFTNNTAIQSIIVNNAAGQLTIKNCTLTRSNTASHIIEIVAGSSLTLQDNTISFSGFNATDTNSSIKISQNASSIFIIERNKFYGGGYGIGLTTGSAVAANASTIIRNNFFNTNWGIVNTTITALKVYHNSFYTVGQCVYGTTLANWDIQNNIFYTYGGGTTCVLMNATTSTAMNYNHYYYPSGTGAVNLSGTTYSLATWKASTNPAAIREANGQGGNAVANNPLYVNTATTDLHLQSTSPAIGVGSSTLGVTDDIDGNARPLGGTYEIGADEYVSTTPTLAATTGATAITATTATSGGNVTDIGTSAVTVKGVCWGTTTGPLATGSHTTDGTGSGSFTSSLTGLSANTTYYVRAYATNTTGTSYGAEVSFTTQTLPTVTTTSASAVASTTATSGGNVTAIGSSAVTAKGVCWSTSTGPTVDLATKTSDGTGTGSFTSSLTGLSANTTYYVRAYATNGGGTNYGTEVSFTTFIPASTTPTVTATATSVISLYSDAYTAATTTTYRNWWQMDCFDYLFADGSHAKKMVSYAAGGCAGAPDSFTTPSTLDVSSMAYLHVDVYPTTALSIDVCLVRNSDGASFYVSLGTLTANQWNSKDIAVTNYAGYTTAVKQVGFRTPNGTGTFYMDNLYFYNVVPNAPAIGSAAVSGVSGTATVAFTAPSSNGGSAITSYTATSSPAGGSGTLNQAGSGTITVTGLANGTAYTFTVNAINAAGSSAASSASGSVTPYTTPSAPTITGITAGDGQLSVAFTAGATGGLAITTYKYSFDGVSWTTRQTGTTASPIVITGLTNGTSYNVQIKAVNASVDGTATGITAATPSTTPSAPSITGITAGDGQLSVAFTAGATGGSAITTYKYSFDGSSWTTRQTGTTASPIVITGLTNGTSYNVQIKAVNANGDGTATSSTSGTPYTVPGVPTSVTATAGSAKASVAFTAPANNGSDITGYTVSSNTGGFSATGTTSPIVVTGLTNGTAYTFTVTATNSAGSGTASSASNSVTPTPATVSVSTDANLSSYFPSSATDVTVSAGELTVDADATVKSMTVNPCAKITLAAGKTLTVGGAFTLQSDATGTATFVDNGGTLTAGTTNVEQYLTSSRNWYISSPVTAATTVALNAPTVITYTEPTATWDILSSGTTLTPMKGYGAVPPTTTGAVTFAGSLNTGDKSISLTRTTGKAKEGFNLVGNPYPSYLDWYQAYAANSGVLSTIWYRTKTGANAYTFDTYNADDDVYVQNGVNTGSYLIPPMQAFWVRVIEGQTDATLTFTNAMRSHNDVTTNKFKAPSAIQSIKKLLRLKVSNGINSDEAIVLFNPNASDGFDTYDSPKMTNANPVVPEIYTQVGTENLVINGLKKVNFDTEIPLGFTPGQSNTFTIKATEIKNFDDSTVVILKDNLLKTEQELSLGNSYSFTSDASPTAKRFSIVFKTNAITTDINDINNQNISINKNKNNQIVVNCVSGLTDQSFVTVYDVVGKPLVTKNLTSHTTVFNTPISAGACLVKVVNAGKCITKKLIFN